MRTRLISIIILIAVGVICFFAGTYASKPKVKRYGWYLNYTLLWQTSPEGIKECFRTNSMTVSTQQISTTKNRFCFAALYSYRGTGFTVYCYEEVQKDTWWLRAVFPMMGGINIEEPKKSQMQFSTVGDTVRVTLDNAEILALKSNPKNQ